MAKVELICGCREAFIANPSLLFGYESEDSNFMWMRNVSPEEAKASYERWKEWAAKPTEERKPKGDGVGEWIYDKVKPAPRQSNHPRYVGPYNSWSEHKAAIEEMNKKQRELDYGLKDSLTPGAKQLDWKTPTEFLLCPGKGQNKTLQAYLNNLEIGKVFTRNKWGDGGIVLDFGINDSDNSLVVLTQKGDEDNRESIKPWALCRITLRDGFYIHENKGSFFHLDGGQKYYTLAMGREWTGGEVMDDLC